jgi:uncharacterized protein YndB with AHSA1/START domain
MSTIARIVGGLAAWTAGLAIANEIRADDDRVVAEAVVDASVDDVWQAVTTKQGMESWMVAHAEIDLKVGGKMLTHYDADGRIGDPNTIENTILSFEPKRMLSIKATKPPEKFPFKEALKDMWTVMRFDPLGPNRTRVSVVSLGYNATDESRKMRDFFEAGNALTLEKLRKKFASNDSTNEGDDALRLLHTLARGEWIFEHARDDGTVFRSRSVITEGPDGQSLIGRGWLGGSEGMFFHAATQIWREPKSNGGGVRFQNIDQAGAIARGAIYLAGPNRVRWEWNSTGLDGELSRYEVEMSFERPDEYRFILFQLTGDDRTERVNITYSRVDDAPERFKAQAERKK